MTAEEALKELEQQTSDQTALCFAATYQFGARFSDVDTDAVREVTDPFTREKFVCITFHEGKVAKRIGQWSLHVRMEDALAIRLLKAKQMAMKKGWKRLFGDHDSRTRELRQFLKPRGMDQRAVRRGALQSVAAIGGVEDVIALSQHRSVAQAKEYLNWGAQDMAAARRVANIASKASLNLCAKPGNTQGKTTA